MEDVVAPHPRALPVGEGAGAAGVVSVSLRGLVAELGRAVAAAECVSGGTERLDFASGHSDCARGGNAEGSETQSRVHIDDLNERGDEQIEKTVASGRKRTKGL